jgi:excinuclease ABC subunit C
MVARPEPGSIPDAPGSYQFLDAEGRVIYVGKAKSLRSRLSNYFAPPATLSERTYQMVQTADHVEWIVAKNEVEAFFLEFNLIKRHKPRFNIRLKDANSYPYLAVTIDEEWQRAMVMRGQHRKEVRYSAVRTPTRSGRRSTCSCAPSRSGRAPTQARPAPPAGPTVPYAHREVAAPCVDDIDHDAYMLPVQS